MSSLLPYKISAFDCSVNTNCMTAMPKVQGWLSVLMTLAKSVPIPFSATTGPLWFGAEVCAFS